MARIESNIVEKTNGGHLGPLFSIVTVTLDCHEDAVLTANSVMSQQFSSYEYLIKDGMSSDDTVGILRRLGQKVVVQSDRGIYDGMNQALGLCRGTYVCFLNAGDHFVDSGTLSRVATSLEINGFPDFAYGDIRTLSRHPVLREPSRDMVYPDRLSSFYLYRKMICHQAWFLKTTLLMSVGGFDQNLQIMSDYALLLQLILEWRVSYLHLAFVTVVYKGNGVSQKSAGILRAERETVLLRHYGKVRLAVFRILLLPIWKAVRMIGYSVYPYLPDSFKKKVHGL